MDAKRAESDRCFAEYLAHSARAEHESDRRQVELDIPRTFPEHTRFRDGLRAAREGSPRAAGESGDLLASLRSVLLALCARDSSVGYCQGMSFVAGTLLLVLENAEDAFWAMCCVCEDIMAGFYSRTLRGAQVETRLMAGMLCSGPSNVPPGSPRALLKRHRAIQECATLTWLQEDAARKPSVQSTEG